MGAIKNDVRPDDMITLSEAAEILEFRGLRPVGGVNKMIERGVLAAYWTTDEERKRDGRFPYARSVVSLADVERLRDERRKRAEEVAHRFQR